MGLYWWGSLKLFSEVRTPRHLSPLDATLPITQRHTGIQGAISMVYRYHHTANPPEFFKTIVSTRNTLGNRIGDSLPYPCVHYLQQHQANLDLRKKLREHNVYSYATWAGSKSPDALIQYTRESVARTAIDFKLYISFVLLLVLLLHTGIVLVSSTKWHRLSFPEKRKENTV